MTTQLHETLNYRTRWTVRKYACEADRLADRPYDVVVVDGNMLLNAGIGLLWDLAIGAGGTAWNNANARIGVGDSTTAEAAGQTALQAATNKTYRAMAASYPQRSAQKVTWRAVFAAADANYDWREFTVDNGTIALNRKVQNLGTKAAGSEWTLDVEITLS